MDASPTKVWLIKHRADSQWKWLYDLAYGKRPSEEIYDVRKDPDMVMNLANEPACAQQKTEMGQRLIKMLTEAKDPRVSDDIVFEKPPFIEPVNGKAKKPQGK